VIIYKYLYFYDAYASVYAYAFNLFYFSVLILEDIRTSGIGSLKLSFPKPSIVVSKNFVFGSDLRFVGSSRF